MNFLITGGARGIGRGLTRLLVEKGHRVVILDNNKAELDQPIHKSSSRIHAEYCDVGNPVSVSDAVEKSLDFLGNRIDCLINNAAVTSTVGGAALADLDLADWWRSLHVNLSGPLMVSQRCLPYLKRDEANGRASAGNIIHMSSTRAYQSEPNSEPYAATKAGLIGLTHSMAVSLADSGIRVNAILPGWINVADECKEADEKGTKWEDGLSPDDHRWHLTGRVGKVQDILRAVEYLIEADFVTGTEVVVDGGVTRKMVYPE